MRNYMRRRIKHAFNDVAKQVILDKNTSYIFILKKELATVEFNALKQEIVSCVKIAFN